MSTTYYALFHLLVDHASRRWVGAAPARAPVRAVVGRTFDHSTMRRVSRAFASGSLPDPLRAISPAPPSADVRFVAQMFAVLQERRHEADYDPLRVFGRAQVGLLIDDAEQAFARWRAVSAGPDAELYLLALTFGDRLRG